MSCQKCNSMKNKQVEENQQEKDGKTCTNCKKNFIKLIPLEQLYKKTALTQQ